MNRRYFLKALSCLGVLGFVAGNVAFWMYRKRRLPPATARGGRDVSSIAFSMDGSRLASVSEVGVVSIWDPATGRRLSSSPAHPSVRMSRVSFLSEDSWLAIITSEGQCVRFWKPGAEQESVGTMVEAIPVCLSFKPTKNPRAGAIVAVGVANRIQFLEKSSRVRSFATASGAGRVSGPSSLTNLFAPNIAISGHAGKVTALSFSRDGSLLASGSSDRTVAVWSMDSCAEVARLHGHTSPINSLSFAHNGRRLATSSTDGTIIIWDLPTKTRLGVLPGHRGAVLNAVFSPDSNWLASTSADNETILWSVEGRFRDALRLSSNPGKYPSIDFSSDGLFFASAWGEDVRFWGTSALVSEARNNLEAT